MILSVMETEHFTFTVLGESEDHCNMLMHELFMEHLKQYGTEWNEDERPMDYYGINYS